MRINNQESDFLYHNKINNGKDSITAIREVEKLRGYELGLTEKNKIIIKLNNEIAKLKTKIEVLTKRLEVKQNKDFKTNFISLTNESDEERKRRLKTFEHRIMNIVSEEEKIGLSALTKICNIPTDIRNIVLKKLEDEKKIKIVKGNFTAVYLNKENECG